MYLPKGGTDLKKYPRGVEGVITELISKNWYTFSPIGKLEPTLNVKWGVYEDPPFVKIKNEIDPLTAHNNAMAFYGGMSKNLLRKYQPLKEEPKKEPKKDDREYIV
jgi:hypothetical protein